MAQLTFRGGVEPGDYKNTADHPIEQMALPDKVYIPLEQHIGAPCEPIVDVGDKVKTGQKIAESEAPVSAPIHASISGEVIDITEYTHPIGEKANTIIIENDGKDELDYEESEGLDSPDNITADEIKEKVNAAGIIGMGGAAFPTHIKISPDKEKPIDTVILNGAECEPYLTTDYRMMLEAEDYVLFGLRAIMKAVNCENGVIAIENNKPQAIEKMQNIVADDDRLQVMIFESKYPQGAEKQLIKTVTGREVPSGGLPMDVGCIVNNVGTAVAIAEAIKLNKPSYERVMTVTGPGINRPGNFLVRIGTLASHIISECGGAKENTKKVIMGGPMMGLSQPTVEFPVIKGTSGILLLTGSEVKVFEEKPCINCGRCVDDCPAYLLPNVIAHYMENGRVNESEDYNAMDCIECGCCTYICPANRPLVHYIRMAKADIMKKREKEG
ncbi:electron transport complex subunit RsxC [Natranaerobius thermophilus]|uniref:Ion-translocating oxidoreductase complex subunit C n=1 Tax=Natranaerobius thermophilus (strain ATCC BAA-1301 / DSM 18059 / JW/NM-WN-LF) TaxID=457570 RepID=B2A142_NATTJ|nr:electron transport complex subunit RsxC [Natranaerobius thermophilus]ACB84665.1 electron transport complex, RnfABCDGE type, C subunit [Natranaerobius thermophilus JW/NM-WN-LF]